MIIKLQSLKYSAIACLLASNFCLAQTNKQEIPAQIDLNAVESWMVKELGDAKVKDFQSDLILTKKQVSQAAQDLQKAYKQAAIESGWDKNILANQKFVEGMNPQIQATNFEQDDKKMPYTVVVRGERPKNGYPLFISLHGGGMYSGKEKLNSPHGWDVNTREWQTQIQFAMGGIYEPAGVYFIPRMADDTLGRWWHPFNIKIFKRAIKLTALFNDVDLNKVYMMGVSQGGYGTCHLAPFMADYLAAAGPMAGGMMTETENLRNLPFRSDIGENDTMYDRIKLAKELHAKLDENRSNDPEGYINELNIQAGRGHGISYRETPNWLVKHTRDPYPSKIVWRCFAKNDHYASDFYWLSLTDTPNKGEFQLSAEIDRKTNSVNLTAKEVILADEASKADAERPLKSSDIIVHLNDKLIDLDKEVIINVNGKQLFKGMVERKLQNMVNNLAQRGDINYAFPAQVTINLKK